MVRILADVGGTNVRFACALDGSIDSARTMRFQNDDYANFNAALTAYLEAQAVPNVGGLTIAVAGPVTGNRARLTNRDWTFDTDDLGREYRCDHVQLINDLSALGYALDSLDASGIVQVLDGATPPEGQLQRLVVGLGTGFNVSPVLNHRGHVSCLLAEAGLASMPSRSMAHLQRFLGDNVQWISCVEDVLSGPGLSRLHAEATGNAKIPSRDVIERAVAGDMLAGETLNVFAYVLAEVVQDLRLQYMPAGGIFFAGSAVRGVLESPARDIFVSTVQAQPTAKSNMPPVAVSVIAQDETALLGCLAYALAED